jgi:hypothetical protein
MTTPDDRPKIDTANEVTPASADADPRDAGMTSTYHPVPHDAVVDFRSQWVVIQQGFVDDPRSAVKDADSLVGDVLEKLRATFEEQRRHLEGQWSDGETDTEELRLTLRRYRDFLDRLLASVAT